MQIDIRKFWPLICCIACALFLICVALLGTRRIDVDPEQSFGAHVVSQRGEGIHRPTFIDSIRGYSISEHQELRTATVYDTSNHSAVIEALRSELDIEVISFVRSNEVLRSYEWSSDEVTQILDAYRREFPNTTINVAFNAF